MLKWSKDGDAKCGPFNIAPNWEGKSCIWIQTKYGHTRISEPGISERDAEAWLRKQAKAMLRDLGAAMAAEAKAKGGRG